ncbi:MAG: hypothetical protein Kow0065_03150 [Methylomicrobium sp.]
MDDSHLHQFIANGTFYGLPDEDFDTEDESQYRLSDLLWQEKQQIQYEYDFGDSWVHIITLEKILPPAPSVKRAVCKGGKRAAPPEDCGGIWGYQDLLEIMRDPKHPEYQAMSEWLGVEAWDENAVPIDEINRQLS